MSVEYSRYLVPSPPTFAPSPDGIVSLVKTLTAEKWLPKRDSPCVRSVRHMVPDENAQVFHDPGTTFPFTMMPWVSRREPSTTYVQLPKFTDSPGIDSSFVQDQLDAGGLLLQYSMWRLDRDNGIRYPLNRLDHARDAAYYDLKFWLSPDYVYLTSETLRVLDSSQCDCGRKLAHEKPCDVFSPCDHFPLQCPDCNAPFHPHDRQFHIRCGYTGDETTVAGGTVFRFAIEIDCGKCIPKAPVDFSLEFRRVCSSTLQCDFIELGSVN